MNRPTCSCCLALPPAGAIGHPHAYEIKNAMVKEVHSLCSACMIEVTKVIAAKVERGCTFQVLKNAIINVQEARAAAFVRAKLGAASHSHFRPELSIQT